MNVNDYVARIRASKPAGLRSVILYGSAVGGDHLGDRSDYNLVVLVEDATTDVLRALHDDTVAWHRQNNPVPLVMAWDRFRASADAFPIEFSDMLDSHQVLWGDDPFPGVTVQREDLARELEAGFKQQMIRLKSSYLLECGKKRRVERLLVESISSTLSLVRAALRLFEPAAPRVKREALDQLADRLKIDVTALRTVYALKARTVRSSEVDLHALFAQYLRAIQAIADEMDRT